MPVTPGAFDTSSNGKRDLFLDRLDLEKTGKSQLVYGTYLGGGGDEMAFALEVDGTAHPVLLTDEYARSWWVLADADGNEACVSTWQDR